MMHTVGWLFRLIEGGHRWYFPLALGAFIAVGVHTSAESALNVTHTLVSTLDSGLESMGNSFVGLAESTSLLDGARAAKWRYELAHLISIEERQSIALWIAIALEILIDIHLLIIGLSFEREQQNRQLQRDWDVYKGGLAPKGVSPHTLTLQHFALPLYAVCATLLATYTLMVAAEGQLGAWLSEQPRGALWATGLAFTLAALLTWRCSIPLWMHSYVFADRLSRDDAKEAKSVWKHRRAGWKEFAFVMPILLLGLWEQTPLGTWVSSW